jgi:hypothetical protein
LLQFVDELGDATLPRLERLGIFNRCNVLPFEPKRQTIKGGSGAFIFLRASERSFGSGSVLGSSSSSIRTSTRSPSAIPLSRRLAALIPTKHLPFITAILLRHLWSLMEMATGGRAPAPNDSMPSFGTSTAVALPEGTTLPGI